MEKNEEYFGDYKVGSLTDKGRIESLFFLTFGDLGAYKSSSPIQGGRGLLMATVNGKNYVLNNLTLIQQPPLNSIPKS